jgi:hypothetical protein
MTEMVMTWVVPVLLALAVMAGAGVAVGADDRPSGRAATPPLGQATSVDDNSTGPFNPNEPPDRPLPARAA